jgi:hypothetical protein
MREGRMPTIRLRVPLLVAATATFITLAISPERALALPIRVPLHCDYDNGTDRTGCAVDALTLAGPQGFATQFEVSYTYRCTGNTVDIGLQTDREYRPFLRASGPQRLTIVGQDYLYAVAPHPAALYAASLSVDCRLEVLGIEATPSDDTLLLWRQQATDQAKILDLALRNVDLARHVEQVVTWDDDELMASETRVTALSCPMTAFFIRRIAGYPTVAASSRTPPTCLRAGV